MEKSAHGTIPVRNATHIRIVRTIILMNKINGIANQAEKMVGVPRNVWAVVLAQIVLELPLRLIVI